MRPVQWTFLLVALSLVSGVQAFNRTVSTSSIYTGNLTLPSNLSIFSPLPLSFNISNTGTSAYSDVLVNIGITGPTDYNTSFYASSLAPGQEETVFVLIPNITHMAGTYTAYVNSSYILGNTKYRSGTGAQFSAWYTRYAVLPGVGGNVSTLQNLNITYMPLFSYLGTNSTFLSQLGVQDASSNAIFVNFSIPSEFMNILQFSSSLLYIRSGESQSASILFKPQPSSPPSAYLVPVTISVRGTGIPKEKQTEYIDFYTMANSSASPAIYNQLYLTNNTQDASGTLQVFAPLTKGINDGIVKLLLGINATPSTFNISLSGGAANVTVQNGEYVLQWRIGSLAPGQNKYLYYYINGVEHRDALRSAQIVLISPGSISYRNLFKLLNTTLPEFYTDNTSNVTVQLQYTGSVPSKLYISLTGPIGSSITNASQLVNATPNEVITRKFGVDPGNAAGTVLLTLSVAGASGNTTYSLPIVVLQGKSQSSQTQGLQPSQAAPIGLPSFIKYVVLSLVLMVGLAAAYFRFSRPRRGSGGRTYRKENADELIQMREQIRKYPSRE